MTKKPTESAEVLRTVSRHIRASSPDLFFVGHFIARERRLAIYSLASVLRVLHDVMNHREAGDDPCAPGACNAAGCTAGSGGECAGETPQQKRAVCGSIIEFLYSGQKTGRPELDAFASVVERFGVRREDLESFADALATRLTTPRLATWVRLRRERLALAGAAARTIIPAMSPEPGEPLDGQAVKHLADGALAVVLSQDLYHLAEHWRDGRLTVALDDLTAAGLSENDLRRFAEKKSVGDDPRWGRLVDGLGLRIGALHEQAQLGLAALEPSCQRAAAVWGLVQRDRFNQWLQAGGDPFAISKEPAGSTWRRVAKLPAAMKVVGRSAKKAGR